MKNILRVILTVLVTILVILLMVKGLSIGSLKIYSISGIIEENKKLDEEIDALNKLKNEDYKKAMDNLNDSAKKLTTAKQSYLDEASISTDSEIKEATISQNYSMEYLWNKVGTYATEEGLKLKWDVQSADSGKYTLSFTITGTYISIINYVYDIENDSDLGFTILNFKISGSDELTATFSVNDVAIKSESISTSVMQQQQQQSSSTNNNEQCNNTQSNQNNTTTDSNQTSGSNTTDNK